ncbi:dihydrolipoyllysine-residue acetyltransferase [Malassezia brasiliensis]|uniref:Acetyltransferase component of pyruvate dehydrogenase complex n=1 Tax=Malassezia brasiliensis TaxID=1821822 RepID=A0AAF0DQB4_9BASI|nr:dihydrolipoyllysine-residue acetyltransferase [Malassezia brasiliensis]
MAASSLHTSAVAEELQKFTMPAMSPTMQDGGIAGWRKKEGESFASGEVLLDIETDKATMEVEATDDGVLAKIIAQAGSKNVPVNSVIAIVGEEGDDLSGADALAKEAEQESASASSDKGGDKKESKKEEKPAKESKPEPERKSQSEGKKPKDSGKDSARELDLGDEAHVFASPIARRLAQNRGVPLAKVKGTGPNGRIVREDVEKYAGGASAGVAAPAPAAAASPEAAYTDTPLSNMRRTIASRLTESTQNVPHYFVSVDVEMDKVLQLREVFNRATAEAAKGDAEKAKAAKLSVNDFIMKAAALALKQVPSVNSAWHGDYIREYHVQDISMAVSTPTGLITPIVRNVGAIGLAEISSESKRLAKKARDGKLKPEEYQGGTFCISNMGMMGTTHFTAIINPPQSAILAIGMTQERIVPDDSERGWRKANIMQATISSDHRVSDGATSARWMQAFKAALENPLSFML